MSPEGHRDMLTQQYLDNWAYQANIRKDIYRMQDSIRTDNVRYSGDLNSKLEEYLQERVQDFSETYLKVDPRTVKATFPWGRLFETDITVYDKPVVPLQKEIVCNGKQKRRDKLKLQQLLRLHQANGQAQAAPAVPTTTTQAAPAATSTTVVHQAATSPRIVPTPAAVPQQ